MPGRRASLRRCRSLRWRGLASLRDAADECVSLWVPDDFGAVGAYYADFEQTTDEEVMALLREALNAQRS
ncbi:hypothetical protein OJJOAM_003739 [Cupriavidus sp. H18C1]